LEGAALFDFRDVPSMPAKRRFIWRVKIAAKSINIVFMVASFLFVDEAKLYRIPARGYG
jgi:hypothetical protein